MLKHVKQTLYLIVQTLKRILTPKVAVSFLLCVLFVS